MVFVYLYPNRQGCASSEGFALGCAGRYTLEYREANRKLRLEGDSMIGGLGDAKWGFSFDGTWRTAKWQPPYDNVPITDEDRERIMQNVKDVLTFMGSAWEFLEK